MGIWKTDVRFIGAGCIAVAALWTLVRLAKPLVHGFKSTIASVQTRNGVKTDDHDTDISGGVIIGLTVVCLALIGWLGFKFVEGTPLASNATMLVAVAIPFTLIVGFIISAICGYMAGLIGSSNSPISSICILAIVTSASIFALLIQVTPENQQPLVAFALFVTSFICAICAISNDNLQDLKTGQLVGAAPWRQQVALIVGVVAGALVIPPVLNLLAQAYGFVGQANLPSGTLEPLAAPQAGLISALAQGVIGHQLNWQMISIGAAVGVAVIAIDEFMRVNKWLRLPPLAIGLAIYLPMSVSAFVIVGAIVGYLYEKFARSTANPERSKRLGVLVASGMIVGESLFGVLLAALILGLSQDTPLALMPADFAWHDIVGVATFLVLVIALYSWAMGRAKTAS